jgi:membrane protease YdiL (CAAX protease family)
LWFNLLVSTPEFIPDDQNGALPEIPVAPPPDPPFGLVEIAAVVSFTLGALLLCGFAGLWLAPHFPIFHGATRAEIANNPLYLVPAQACAYLFAFAFMRMLITLRAQQDFWPAIKWNRLPVGDMVTFSFGGVVLALTTQLISHFLPIPKELPMDKYFAQPSYIYLMMAFGILVAPLMEELFFRGLVFPVAVRYLGLSFGTVLTAALFAIIHQGQLAHAWAPLTLLFLVGMVLTTIRAMTKSVAASWITHMSYNATLFALLFYATGGLKHLDKM